jgi:type II secretory pathway pseudopilin PulG
MDPKVLLAIIVVLAIVVIAVVVFARRRQRSTHLKQQFGQEYERALMQHGDAGKAEAALGEREARVQKLTIRELPATERAAYADEWAAVQRRFVDDPSMAVSEADRLVNRVMNVRGYPMADFDQRIDDISVNYPAVVQNYRSARDIFVRHSSGRASTEDLRQAMVYYRSLFDELLGTPALADPAVLRRAS